MDENPSESPQTGKAESWGCGWLLLLLYVVPALIYGAFLAMVRICSPN